MKYLLHDVIVPLKNQYYNFITNKIKNQKWI